MLATRTKRARRAARSDPPAAEADHDTAADLELLAGLYHRRASGLTYDEWRAVLAALPAVRRRVVVLHLFLGMTLVDVGARMGFSRGRADQHWRDGVRQLAAVAHVFEGGSR